MEINKIAKYISEILSDQHEILFGYIHGSILYSKNPHDIDIAVFIDPEQYKTLLTNGNVNIGFAIPLEMEIEKRICEKVDVQVLNGAPLVFQYRVIECGTLVKDTNSNARTDFEYLARVKYFDFRPKVQEYLREIVA
jgi:hypothetical protein